MEGHGRQMCETCMSIAFHDLPSMEEDGIPHLPSYDALEQSATKCPLCNLLCFSVGASAHIPGGMVKFGPGLELPSGKTCSVNWAGSMYNKMGMKAMENGAVSLDFSHAKPDLREPVFRSPREFVTDGQAVRPWLFGNWYASPFKDRKPLLVGLGVRLGTGPRVEDAIGIHKISGDDMTIVFPGTFLRVRADEGARAASYIPGRLRTAHQGSEIAFARIKEWMDNCSSHHPCDSGHSCASDSTSPLLPTRVLDVGDSSSSYVFLAEPKDVRDHYIALSHCWGTSHRLITLNANLQRHKLGIHMDDLAATFRDAIEITRKLEIKYVWIDSLCIIQDDFDDWEREAVRMGDVYSHAYLTISALTSSDDADGIFNDVGKRWFRPLVSSDTTSTGRRCFKGAAPLIHIDTAESGERVHVYSPRYDFGVCDVENAGSCDALRIYVTPEWLPPSVKPKPKGGEDPLDCGKDTQLYLVGEFGGTVDPFQDEPLSKRAWTLQERVLSQRTLHFGSDEMLWECRYCVLAEDGAMLQRDFPTNVEVLRSRVPKSPPVDTDETPQMRDPWFRLIEDYSARLLTRPDDKLPALAGLAASVAKSSGDTYYAGVWRRDLLRGMNWEVLVNEPTHHCDDPAHDAAMAPPTKAFVGYPQQYRAPSWSWASIDARVRFWPVGERDDDPVVAECVDVRVIPAGRDRFGMIKGGWMKLKTPLYTVRSAEPGTRRKTNLHPFTRSVEIVGAASRGVVAGTATFDDGIHLPCFAARLSAGSALLLELRRDEKGEIIWEGQKGGGDEGWMATFRRIGRISIYPGMAPRRVRDEEEEVTEEVLKVEHVEEDEPDVQESYSKASAGTVSVGSMTTRDAGHSALNSTFPRGGGSQPDNELTDAVAEMSLGKEDEGLSEDKNEKEQEAQNATEDVSAVAGVEGGNNTLGKLEKGTRNLDNSTESFLDIFDGTARVVIIY